MTVQELLDKINAMVEADPSIATRKVVVEDEQPAIYRPSCCVAMAQLGKYRGVPDWHVEVKDGSGEPFPLIS